MKYLIILISFVYTANIMADEVCATIDYLEDEYKSSNAIDNERFMKLEIERFNHRKALLHGVLCMNVSEDSSSIIHEICSNLSGTIGLNHIYEAQDKASSNASRLPIANYKPNSMVIEIFTSEEEGNTPVASMYCGHPQNAHFPHCSEVEHISKLANNAQENDATRGEWLDIAANHTINLPIGQKNGTVETRLLLTGSNKTTSETYHGKFSLSECPKKTRADRIEEKVLSKEIARMSRQ